MLHINKQEVLRYMGHRNGTPDPHIMQTVDRVIAEFEKSIKPRYVWREYDITIDADTIAIGGIAIKSSRLAQHLCDCSRVAVLAATLGVGADVIIRRALTAGTLDGSASQAVGAAMVEAACDTACNKISEETGLYTKPRFSAGYGDFDIAYQQDMLNLSDATKRIGITLSDSLMMIPTKSVTAIVGLTANNACARGGCEQCDKKDCDFRI